MATKQIRILVVPPTMPPEEHVVAKDSWRTWYPLISPTTRTFQAIEIAPNIDLLCDEDGISKNMAVNVLLPARAPQVDLDAFNVIVVPPQHRDGRRLMMPNEPGIGYYEILGTFLIARRRGESYVDLTKSDIEKLKKKLNR